MGRAADRSLAGSRVLGLEQRHETPFEDPGHGCPGAYYRTAYVDDVWGLLRRRTKDGGRVPNPAFDRAHWAVQQAVTYLEQEEERWHAYVDGEIARRMQADIDESKRKS